MNSAMWLICRTLGVATEREAHGVALQLAGCEDAAPIAGLAAARCLRRALESSQPSVPLRTRVTLQLEARSYSGPVERGLWRWLMPSSSAEAGAAKNKNAPRSRVTTRDIRPARLWVWSP